MSRRQSDRDLAGICRIRRVHVQPHQTLAVLREVSMRFVRVDLAMKRSNGSYRTRRPQTGCCN
jgi:hypothetical protein